QTACRNQEAANRLFHGFEVILRAPEDIELAKLDVDTSFQDYVVEKVLERNKWDDMLIVSDMTGSMAPYIGQLFLWLKLNTLDDRIKQFVFFNDGDTQLNEAKAIGATGGIYETRSKTYAAVEELAVRCMMSGDGGDLEENDIEALLAGMALCPDCAEHILIADNNSPMRDYELLKQINKPIRIIICGVQHKVNIEYLNLARQTGGSVHLIERDLYHLTKINEGETLEIGEQKFIIRQNKFVEVKKI
ncbi:MAG: hypothetical protein KDC44_15700, partial [Phaeodactylibacter sp.]|nr:hypothetical protein [Phaeodactylibacter sp.]